MTGVRLKFKDNGYEKFLAAAKDASSGKGVSVGVHAAQGAEPQPQKGSTSKPVTILDVAIWNEFGTEKIPERSFIRGWADENMAAIQSDLARAVKNSLTSKMPLAQGLAQLGAKFVGQIQQRMAAGIGPPNAASTISRKGSSKQLIDTGAMRQAITFLVRS